MLLKISYTFKLTGGPFTWARCVAGNQTLKKSSPMIRYRILARLIKQFLRIKVTTQLRAETAGYMSLRGVKRRSNPGFGGALDCFARNDNLLPPLTEGLRIKNSRRRQ